MTKFRNINNANCFSGQIEIEKDLYTRISSVLAYLDSEYEWEDLKEEMNLTSDEDVEVWIKEEAQDILHKVYEKYVRSVEEYNYPPQEDK